jgi:hypothetical protein
LVPCNGLAAAAILHEAAVHTAVAGRIRVRVARPVQFTVAPSVADCFNADRTPPVPATPHSE